MKIEDIKERLELLEQERKLVEAEVAFKNYKSVQTRARSVTVGTSFGGTTEVSMRGDGGDFLWCPLQPVEVTELIHQLAGNIGCHILIQPRQDFASWRDWKVTDDQRLHLNGHPPFPNNLNFHMETGKKFPAEELQPGLQKKITRNENEPLAITKTINKRKSKRTSDPT